MLSDGFQRNRWEGFLTGGLRLKLAQDAYLELEGEWLYLNPGRRTFELRPQLGTEMQWRF